MQNICINCNSIESKKYVRGYCIVCYNQLLKNGSILKIEKNIPKNLSSRQIEILNGLMLGDGHLERRKNTHNSILRVERSIKDELYLIDNFYEFEKLCSSKPTYRNLNGERKFVKFNTRSISILNEWHNSWYKNKIKIIPRNLALTKLTCAIWLCDDGFVFQNRNTLAMRLCTHSFSEKENHFLCDELNRMYKTKFIVSKIDEKYFCLNGANESTILFIEAVKQYIPNSMQRKLKYYCGSDDKLFTKLE